MNGTTLPAAAIAFPLKHPAVVNVTLGMRNPDQVRRNTDLHGADVPTALWADLHDQELIGNDPWGGNTPLPPSTSC